MDLAPRKKAIIAEIVKAYIETGEPIGSKILATRLKNAPSSATLRNEMSDLCEMGYLEQPHTSAGRVPTKMAYKLYISELMPKTPLSKERKEIIDRMLEPAKSDPEAIGSAAADVLSKLTGLPVVSVTGSQQGLRLKRISLMPVGRSVAVVFVVSEDGRTRNRLCSLSSPIDARLISVFDKISSEKICSKDIAALDMAYLQSVVASSGLDALTLAPLFSCVFELAAQLKRTQVDMGGAANLFSLCPSDVQAKSILDLLSTGEVVHGILSSATSPVEVVFGDQTEYSELKPTGLVVASYGKGNKYGKLAVIGPTRMAYENILPSAAYVADRVGEMIGEVLKGLEEY